MKYPMTKNTEQPLFNYIVKSNDSFNYYLYSDFDTALKKVMEISNIEGIGILYELYFNNSTREYRAHPTFKAFDGKAKYDKHERVALHIHFYINAGEWLNPNENWLALLNRGYTE